MGGFKKSYVIKKGRGGLSRNLMFSYKLNGWVKRRPKPGEVKYDWSQCGPLEKSISPCIRARVPIPKVVKLENVAEKIVNYASRVRKMNSESSNYLQRPS